MQVSQGYYTGQNITNSLCHFWPLSKGLFTHSCHPYHRDSHFPGIKLTSPGYAIGGHPLFTSVYISPNSALRKYPQSQVRWLEAG